MKKFFFFMKNAWIIDFGTPCDIINDDTDLYDVNKMNESVQGSSGSMSATKKGKLHMEVNQAERSVKSHTLWPMRYWAKAGANLFCLHAKPCKGIKSRVTGKTTL